MAGLQPGNSPATSPMTPVAALMTLHAWPDFSPGNINHELCHYTDDVTRMTGLQPRQHQP